MFIKGAKQLKSNNQSKIQIFTYRVNKKKQYFSFSPNINIVVHPATVGNPSVIDQIITSYNIAGYSGPGGEILIPSTYGDDKKVIYIDLSIFDDIDISSLTIPRYMSTILNNVNSPTFTTFNVDENNLIFSASDGVLFDKNKLYIISYPRGKSDISYTVPEGTEELAEYAFKNCTNLINITLPTSMLYIDETAFFGCSNLETITFLGEKPELVNGGNFENVSAILNYCIEKNSWNQTLNFGGLTAVPNSCIPINSRKVLALEPQPFNRNPNKIIIDEAGKNSSNGSYIWTESGTPNGIDFWGPSGFIGPINFSQDNFTGWNFIAFQNFGQGEGWYIGDYGVLDWTYLNNAYFIDKITISNGYYPGTYTRNDSNEPNFYLDGNTDDTRISLNELRADLENYSNDNYLDPSGWYDTEFEPSPDQVQIQSTNRNLNGNYILNGQSFINNENELFQINQSEGTYYIHDNRFNNDCYYSSDLTNWTEIPKYQSNEISRQDFQENVQHDCEDVGTIIISGAGTSWVNDTYTRSLDQGSTFVNKIFITGGSMASSRGVYTRSINGDSFDGPNGNRIENGRIYDDTVKEYTYDSENFTNWNAQAYYQNIQLEQNNDGTANPFFLGAYTRSTYGTTNFNGPNDNIIKWNEDPENAAPRWELINTGFFRQIILNGFSILKDNGEDWVQGGDLNGAFSRSSDGDTPFVNNNNGLIISKTDDGEGWKLNIPGVSKNGEGVFEIDVDFGSVWVCTSSNQHTIGTFVVIGGNRIAHSNGGNIDGNGFFTWDIDIGNPVHYSEQNDFGLAPQSLNLLNTTYYGTNDPNNIIYNAYDADGYRWRIANPYKADLDELQLYYNTSIGFSNSWITDFGIEPAPTSKLIGANCKETTLITKINISGTNINGLDGDYIKSMDPWYSTFFSNGSGGEITTLNDYFVIQKDGTCYYSNFSDDINFPFTKIFTPQITQSIYTPAVNTPPKGILNVNNSINYYLKENEWHSTNPAYDPAPYGVNSHCWIDMASGKRDATLIGSPTHSLNNNGIYSFNFNSNGEPDSNMSQCLITSEIPQSDDKSISYFTWVNIPSYVAGNLVVELGQPQNNGYWHDSQIEIDIDGRIHFGIWGEGQLGGKNGMEIKISSPGASFWEQWLHLGITYKDGKLNAYINGYSIGSVLINRLAPESLYYSLCRKETTCMTTCENLTATIGGFKVYTKCLAPSEVIDLYNNEKNIFNPTTSISSSPVITNIEQQDTNLQVQFDSPNNDGGCSVQNYFYKFKKLGENYSQWIEASNYAFTLEGLDYNAEYCIVMSAINCIGQSLGSQEVCFTMSNP